MTEFRRSSVIDADGASATSADDADFASAETLSVSRPVQARSSGEPGSPSMDDRFEALLRRAVEQSSPVRTGLAVTLRPGLLLRGGRLRVIERIGEGGMGVVWKALDAERAGLVALKTLSRLDPEGVYRLKHEFRALAEVSHPNLCRLYELFREEGDWFFTMELVAGERFDDWVRPHGQLDESRLRSAALQLCDGIRRIHEAGKLHRDLKPSNVLVTEQGRVVVLDFGLATDQTDRSIYESATDGTISGTPAYMAPEQAAAEAATTASDLYAFGVMLFESLTDSLPFSGSALQMYMAKQAREAPRASSVAPEVPADLDALCSALLARAPEQRPSGEQVRVALTSRQAPPLSAASSSAYRSSIRPTDATLLIGREAELASLNQAHAAAVAGKPVVLFVSGESGMGKSVLVSAFLAQRKAAGDAVVLAGRCNERENVPFKAFDALVDDLTRYLRWLSREQVLALLPREIYALTRLFPALERVAVVAEAPAKPLDDPQELRRRAFAAFGELIGRIRDRQPLCIFIDDVQWIDQDSVLFLRSLLVDIESAPVLLVMSHRSEGANQNALLQALREVAQSNTALLVQTLAVAPLEEPAARTLVLHALPAATHDRAAVAANIAREAGGSPFFLTALARHTAQSDGPLAGLSLSDVLRAHLATLEPAARALLEVTALAGRPLKVELLLAASSSTYDALDELRSRHFTRVSSHDQGKTIECYHDRIRETVAAELSDAARAERYRTLAEALRAQEGSDLELLATCFEGCGQLHTASHHAAAAAQRAEQAMAFDRAAELFRKALQLAPDDVPERHAHKVALAVALAHAGRAKEAADAYLVAAADVTGIENVELRRCAAEELLTGGYPAEGEALIRQACRDVDVHVPARHAAAMLAYAAMQARLRIGGVVVPKSGPDVLSDAARLRLNVARTAIRLTVGDPVFGLWAGSNYLLAALAQGDAAHCAYALAQEAANVLMLSPKSESRIAHLFELAQQTAQNTDAARLELQGQLAVFEGIGFSFGRAMAAERSRALLLGGIERLQGVRGVRWDIDLAHVYLMRVPPDDLANEARRCALLVEEAFSLGRVWAAGHMAAASSSLRLMVGDMAGVIRHLEQAKRVWQVQAKMQWMDASLLGASVQIANYTGEFAAAWQHVQTIWPWYQRSPLRRAAVGVAVMHSLRGGLALSLARQSGVADDQRQRLLATARDDLRTALKYKELYPNYVLGLRVGLALAVGDKARAAEELRVFLDFATGSKALPRLSVVAAQRRLGELCRASDGGELLAAAESSMKAMGVVDVERTTNLMLPACAVDV